jgi:hypothetical protein
MSRRSCIAASQQQQLGWRSAWFPCGVKEQQQWRQQQMWVQGEHPTQQQGVL